MSTPEHRPPGPSQPGVAGGGSPITRDILEAYLNCHYKGYLKLIGERGTKCDYEVMATEVRQELRRRASEGLVRRYRGEDILRAPVITPATLGAGPPLILDAVVENGGVSLGFDGLKRGGDPPPGGGDHYIPGVVVEGGEGGEQHRPKLGGFWLGP